MITPRTKAVFSAKTLITSVSLNSEIIRIATQQTAKIVSTTQLLYRLVIKVTRALSINRNVFQKFKCTCSSLFPPRRRGCFIVWFCCACVYFNRTRTKLRIAHAITRLQSRFRLANIITILCLNCNGFWSCIC